MAYHLFGYWTIFFRNRSLPIRYLMFLVIASGLISPSVGLAQNNKEPGTITRGIPSSRPVKAEYPEQDPSVIKGTNVDTASILNRNPSKKNLPPSLAVLPPKAEKVDTAVINAYHRSLQAYYYAIERKNLSEAQTADSIGAYYKWALKNRQQIIYRQQITGSVIFILVALLLLSGLVFSAIQFIIAIKTVKKKGALLPDTTLKATLGSIEVSSSILGIIILSLSLAFFYLYLINVYPLVSLDFQKMPGDDQSNSVLPPGQGNSTLRETF